jgi:hypothetical protein
MTDDDEVGAAPPVVIQLISTLSILIYLDYKIKKCMNIFFFAFLYTFAIPEQKRLYFATQNKGFYPNLLWISVTNVVIFAQILLFLLHFRFRQKNMNVQTGLYCSRRLLMGADKSKTQEVFIFKAFNSPNLFVPVAVLLDEPVTKRVECRVGVRVPRLHHPLQADS